MLSLSPLTVLPCSPLEQIEVAHIAGFNAVGLRLLPVMETDIDVMADSALRRQISRRLQTSGLSVLDVEVVRISPETDIASVLPVLQYAGDLGARTIALTSVSRDEYDAAAEPVLFDKLQQLCESAAQYGIKPMLEFMVYRGIGTLSDAVRVVRSVEHPNLGICVDALHLSRSGGLPADVAAVEAGKIHCIQLCDAPAALPAAIEIPKEARSGRLFPGDGELPLRELLEAVAPDVPIGVEVPNPRSAMSAMARAEVAMRSARKLIDSIRSATSE